MKHIKKFNESNTPPFLLIHETVRKKLLEDSTDFTEKYYKDITNIVKEIFDRARIWKTPYSEDNIEEIYINTLRVHSNYAWDIYLNIIDDYWIIASIRPILNSVHTGVIGLSSEIIHFKCDDLEGLEILLRYIKSGWLETYTNN